MKIAGANIKVQGRLIRIGRIVGDKYKFLDDPEVVLNGLRESAARVDLFTFMQRLPDTSPKFAYPMEWDNLAVMPVSTFENWWAQQIGFKGRNKAKQAEKKGVALHEVTFDEGLVRGIWEIYNECPVRQGRRFPHFGKDPETVRKEEATFLDSSVFIGAFLRDKLIGFAKLVWDDTRTQANLMNIISMIGHRDKAPTNALIAHAVRACADRGIRYLVYSNFAYGKRHRDSLSDFKERSGFRRVDLPRYYVPLTPLGWIAFRFGMHHRLAERIPGSIVARARELRSAWYSLKIRSRLVEPTQPLS
jgi:hypothetical protein